MATSKETKSTQPAAPPADPPEAEQGTPEAGVKGLIMTTQEGRVTTAEEEAGLKDGGQDS